MKAASLAVLVWLVSLGLLHAINPPLPVIPSTVFNITNYGAVGDGVKDNTTNIQNTINAANAAGGGIVEVPAGTFLSGQIILTNNIDLQVDTNGLLQMLPLYTYPGGVTNAQTFVYCDNIHDLEISGWGKIDGQGAAWWTYNATNNTIVRPMLLDLHNVNRMFIHDITFQNPPFHHCGVRDSCGNVTISNLTVNTVSPSPNTDGVDFTATNSIIENSSISDGDDNLAIGSTGPVSDLLITNCFFGTGHGVSILGPTAPMSNLTLINCAFNGTANGIRWKCLIGSSAPVQNINYYNVTMTNVGLPIVIYSYYNETGTPDKITPSTVLAASNTAPITATTPVWRDITISNLTIASSTDIGGVIWGPAEMPITNLTLECITNTAPKTFDFYNVYGVNVINSRFNLTNGTTFTLCNAGVTISNTTAVGKALTLGGATSVDSLALYHSPASMSSTNLFAASPLTLSDSVLTSTGNLIVAGSTVMNFTLGANAAKLAVVGNLTLGGTCNFTAGGGFTNGAYTLLTYTGTLNGSLPVLGSAPAGYNYTFNTSTAGLVNVVAAYTGVYPVATTNTIQSSANPSVYGTTVTFTANVSPAPTNGETVSFMDGAATLGTGILSGGQAAFSTPSNQLATGTHLITAVYPGDGLYVASTSAVLRQTVNPPPGTFFSDNFSSSTVDSATPAAPAPISTSYEVLSGKTWVPTPADTDGDLVFGIGGTSSGVIEIQAQFASPPVTLANSGDFIQLQVTFTNTAGILSQMGNWDFGLYQSGGVAPLAGGLNAGLTSTLSAAATGGAQNWQGYVAEIGYTGSTSGFYDREPQTGSGNNNQDLVSMGTSSSYQNPFPVGIGAASTTPSVTLAVGAQYTEILRYTLTASNALQLQSLLYAGPATNGTLLSAMSAVTGTVPLAWAFDGLAFGWRAEGSTPSEMNVSSITVTGQSTPPVLTQTLSASTLTLSWPVTCLGWLLQSNSTGLASGNWATVPGSESTNNYGITISPGAGNVFYRLVTP